MENTYRTYNNFYRTSGYVKPEPQYVEATIIEEDGSTHRTNYQQSNWQTSRSYSPVQENASIPKGVAKIAGGGLLGLIGVPMLILPGPGLLTIAGGVALVVSGVKDIYNVITR